VEYTPLYDDYIYAYWSGAILGSGIYTNWYVIHETVSFLKFYMDSIWNMNLEKTFRENFEKGIHNIKSQGWKILTGGSVVESEDNFMHPTIAEISSNAEIMKEKLFVPVLYAMKFKTFEETVEINNSVPQGLSSSIFTLNPDNIYLSGLNLKEVILASSM